MLRLAGRAIAPPAPIDGLAAGTAIRAESMSPVPSEQRLCRRQRRQMLAVHKGAHCDRTQVRDPESVARLECFGDGGLERKGKSRRIAHEPEEHGLSGAAKCVRLAEVEERVVNLPRLT